MRLASARPLSRLRWTAVGDSDAGERLAAEETPVAIVHDGSTTAVMMATPADFEDFGVGFSLTEGVVDSPAAIRDIEVVEAPLGVEVRLWLAADAGARLARRRRRLAGPTGCGLCGVESLAEAVRPARRLGASGFTVGPDALIAAMEDLAAAQTLGQATRAVHAAGLWRPADQMVVREDVGRHNALDKLVGACARTGVTAQDAVLLLTSRVSVEMVQKAAVLGTPVICAVSAPTALAVRTAEAAGITLAGIVRADGMEVFTLPERIRTGRAIGELGAIILTGGASSRMGRDKAKLKWGGARAVDHCVALAEAVGAAAIVTVGGAALGYPHVEDPAPLGGPVGGIVAGGRRLAGLGCERALVLAVDAPTIQPGDLAALLDQPGAGAAFSDLHLPLVFALERLPAAAAPGLPIRRFVDQLGLMRIAPRPDLVPRLRGANTPTERALLLAERSSAREGNARPPPAFLA